MHWVSSLSKVISRNIITKNKTKEKKKTEQVIVMYSEKMKEKCMKEDVWKSFFVNFQVGISQLHKRLTSSQTVFRDFN